MGAALTGAISEAVYGAVQSVAEIGADLASAAKEAVEGAIASMAMRDLDAALAADPLFHLCPDGHEGQVDVRYWYFHPLNLTCRHCSEGGGICVVEPATVICRHRMARRTARALEG